MGVDETSRLPQGAFLQGREFPRGFVAEPPFSGGSAHVVLLGSPLEILWSVVVGDVVEVHTDGGRGGRAMEGLADKTGNKDVLGALTV